MNDVPDTQPAENPPVAPAARRSGAAMFFSVLVLVLAVAGVAAGWVYMDAKRTLNSPMDTGETAVTFVIEPGATLREVAANLSGRSLLRKPHYLVWFARWRGTAARIKAGEYRVVAGTTPIQLLRQFVNGQVVQHTLTIVEGATFGDLIAAVRKHPHIVQTLDGLGPAAIMGVLGLGERHPEGLFFPDTYHFPSKTTDVVFLKRAYDTMQVELERAWVQRAPGLPYANSYEALIMASIVEKETGMAQERARIAGVFVSRLQKGMRLETDPTVIYGMGEAFDGNIRRKDLSRDTPYNTYVHKGLPPTPIALPGAAAIEAALHPVQDGMLFFVAKGGGGHQFSATFREHRKAVTRYQRRKRR